MTFATLVNRLAVNRLAVNRLAVNRLAMNRLAVNRLNVNRLDANRLAILVNLPIPALFTRQVTRQFLITDTAFVLHLFLVLFI